MKSYSIILLSLSACFLAGCGNKDGRKEAALCQDIWQLEYISGQRTSFEGLFPDKKPEISFDAVKKEVVGNAGCNGYSAEYTIEGMAISFGEPGPATKMYCGPGEQQFLIMMRQVDAFDIDAAGKLLLMNGGATLLRLKRKAG